MKPAAATSEAKAGTSTDLATSPRFLASSSFRGVASSVLVAASFSSAMGLDEVLHEGFVGRGPDHADAADGESEDRQAQQQVERRGDEEDLELRHHPANEAGRDVEHQRED